MSWCWLALVDERPPDCIASAQVFEHGREAGLLAAWRRGRKPDQRALRGDLRFIDPAGAPAWLSLVLPPPGVRVPFDDLAVQQARRELLAGAWALAMTALLRDASHFEGSLVAVPDGDEQRLRDDPFARLFPARVLRADAGLVAAVPPPVGPSIERYGSAQPWPADLFPAPAAGLSPAAVATWPGAATRPSACA